MFQQTGQKQSKQQNASSHSSRIKVHLKKRDKFFNNQALEEVVNNRKKASDGKAFNWLKIRWLRFQKGNPFQIMCKHTFKDDETFRNLNIKQEEEGKPRKKCKAK